MADILADRSVLCRLERSRGENLFLEIRSLGGAIGQASKSQLTSRNQRGENFSEFLPLPGGGI